MAWQASSRRRLIVARGLEDLGYRAWTAAGSRRTSGAGGRHAFDSMLLGHRLPVGNGQVSSAEPARQQPRASMTLLSTDRVAAMAEIDSDPVASACVDNPVRVGRLQPSSNAGGRVV